MHSDNSARYRELAEKAKAIEEKWLASVSTRVLTINIHTSEDVDGIHVSCQTLSGEEAMSSNLSAEATLADLELEMKSTLNWLQLEFVCENGMVDVSEPLKAYKTVSAKEVPFSGFNSYRIDRQKCRRCGGENIWSQRFTEWCKMNGDAGGIWLSTCNTCGLHLSEHWDDD
mmetsp:Transcript_120457/g.239740  ORF Transcript_120457/g.239740 Transcript_120457/m.239740 type:complete len:171 (+) Transcript_120457:59-571(+)